MRFYQYWNGFIWEFNSLGEYFLAVLSFIIMVKENGPILLNFGIS